MAIFEHLFILASLAFALVQSKCSDPSAALDSAGISKLVGEWDIVSISEVKPRTECGVMRHFIDDPTGALKMQAQYCDSGVKGHEGKNATLILAHAKFEAQCNDSTRFIARVSMDQRGSVPFDESYYHKIILSDNFDKYVVWYTCIPKSYVDPEPTNLVMIFWKRGVPENQTTIEQVIKDVKVKVPDAYKFHTTDNNECCQK